MADEKREERAEDGDADDLRMMPQVMKQIWVIRVRIRNPKAMGTVIPLGNWEAGREIGKNTRFMGRVRGELNIIEG